MIIKKKSEFIYKFSYRLSIMSILTHSCHYFEQ